MAEIKIKKISPQKGFQENFLSSSADIVIGGSGAGVGKTFASLIEGVRHIDNPGFGAVFFRRTLAQVKNEGGLWDESMKLYPILGAKPNNSELYWKFPSGATVSFSHLQYEKDILTFQGSQIPLLIFDELTHFSESQFWYMISRNRSTCGVSPYVRATCNPDPDSFVAKLIDWWIDEETGFPIPERAGKLRYFIRDNGNMIWGDTKQEVRDKAPYILEQFDSSVDPDDLIKSLTLIPGNIYDNKELLKTNPEYLSNLLSQDEAIKAQLLEGNWKIRTDSLSLFNWSAINDIFDNYLSDTDKTKRLVCDAARYGRDYCVIMVFSGWEIIHTSVLTISDVHDIIKEIEKLRVKFLVQKSNCLVDADGVGGDTVRMGQYRGFSGGAQPKKVAGFKEDFKNLKTQMYYYLAERKVNQGDFKVNINNQTCCVDGVFTTKIKRGSKIIDVRDLIKEDLRAIKRKDPDKENKKQIETKEEQRVILGRSPDFSDTMMMRCLFEFLPKSQYL